MPLPQGDESYTQLIEEGKEKKSVVVAVVAATATAGKARFQTMELVFPKESTSLNRIVSRFLARFEGTTGVRMLLEA
jgi:hypothetical protein